MMSGRKNIFPFEYKIIPFGESLRARLANSPSSSTKLGQSGTFPLFPLPPAPLLRSNIISVFHKNRQSPDCLRMPRVCFQEEEEIDYHSKISFTPLIKSSAAVTAFSALVYIHFTTEPVLNQPHPKNLLDICKAAPRPS